MRPLTSGCWLRGVFILGWGLRLVVGGRAWRFEGNLAENDEIGRVFEAIMRQDDAINLLQIEMKE